MIINFYFVEKNLYLNIVLVFDIGNWKIFFKN